MSPRRLFAAASSTSNGGGSRYGSGEWRKRQLEKLESKFTEVTNDEDLQPMWREMESRVVKRKPRTLRDTGGRTGRINIRKTDEDIWLQEGLYETTTTNEDNDGDVSSNGASKDDSAR